MSGRLKAERGSGNVFSDLGFPVDKFSLDALVIMLNKAGMHIVMRILKAA